MQWSEEQSVSELKLFFIKTYVGEKNLTSQCARLINNYLDICVYICTSLTFPHSTNSRPTTFFISLFLDIHRVLSWRSVCLRTGAQTTPVPAAACHHAAVLDDWRGSARLTGTTTGAAGRLPIFACWNMRAPGSRTNGGKKKARRWSTTFTDFLLGPSTYHLERMAFIKMDTNNKH